MADATAQPALGESVPVQVLGVCAALLPEGSTAARWVVDAPEAAAKGVTLRLRAVL